MRKIAIIGGGLGGTACANSCAHVGMHPVIFEADNDIAAGGSGNPLAMVNPRLQKKRDGIGDFYMTAFLLARRQLPTLQARTDIGYRECGTLFLITEEKLRAKYEAACANFDPQGDMMACVEAARASAIAGIALDYDALWLSTAACVCPHKLCRVMAQQAEIRLNTPVASLDALGDGWRVYDEIFDAVILANGPGVTQIEQARWLPVSTVRGQIAACSPGPVSTELACNLNYGGYCTPAFDNGHVLGASFEPDRDDTAVDDATTDHLLAKFAFIAPALSDDLTPVTARAGLRVAAKDRRPVIGPIPDKQQWQAGAPVYHENLYVNTAFGSHGIIGALAGAQIVTDALLGRPVGLSRASLSAVAPERFLERYARKGRM